MKKLILISTATSALFAGAVFAQDNDTFVTTTDAVTANSTVFGNSDAGMDLAEDIQEEVADNISSGNDPYRYASSAYAQGFRGTIAGSVTFNSGEENSSAGAVGANFSYGSGPWNQSATIAANFQSEDLPEGGDSTDFDVYGTYDIARDFTPRFYGYGQLRGSQQAENYDTDVEVKSTDFFGGVGVGYRIFAEENLAWRVQGAVGYRSLDNGLDSDDVDYFDTEEGAFIIESKLFYAFNDAVSLTNDTSMLYSDSDTETVNELGVNYAMGGPLSLRAAWRIQNNSDLYDAVSSIDDVNQTTTLSVVYALN